MDLYTIFISWHRLPYGFFMQVIDMLEPFFPGRVGSSTGDANGMTHRTFPLFHAVASAGAITMMGLLVLVPSSPSHSDTGTVEITMENWAPYYQPSSAVIVPGTPVRWMNPTASPHTIRHDGCLSDGALRLRLRTCVSGQQLQPSSACSRPLPLSLRTASRHARDADCRRPPDPTGRPSGR